MRDNQTLQNIRDHHGLKEITRRFVSRQHDEWFREIGETYSVKEGVAAVWAGYELLKIGHIVRQG